MTLSNTILLATRNQGKIKELGKMLTPFRLKVLGLEHFPEIEEIAETGSSFEENAMLKATHAAQKSGLVAVADDSGLMVDALNGAPGIYSARFSHDDNCQCEADLSLSQDELNNKKLLRLMADVPREERSARFCSVIAAVAPTGQKITTLGIWEGIITRGPQGENGFGYDPLFLDPDLGLTAAQMSPHEKNERSHRFRAMQALAELWPDFWASLS